VGGTLDETWEWDGNEWTERGVAGPPARANAALTALGAKLVLFGGGQSAQPLYLADTWDWDAARWTRVDGSGPAARTSAALSAR
jgi:hypothetical protein